MSVLKQIASVTLMNIKSVPQRLGASSVIVIGIAGVVGVLVSILAMVGGLSQMMTSTERADRAIVVSTGAGFETLSNITREATQIISDAPGIKHRSDGKPLTSPDALAIVRLPLKRGGNGGNVSLRGVSEAGLAVRPEIQLVEGRLFGSAVREVIVGRTLQRQFRDLELGKQFLVRGVEWTVVGVFESHGDPHEAEMITGAETLQSAFERNTFQSVTVLLDSAESYAMLKAALTGNPALSVDAMREAEYYQQQSHAFSQLLTIVAYLIGGIMALRGDFRRTECHVFCRQHARSRSPRYACWDLALRRSSSRCSLRALLLAILGGAVGGCVAWLMFNGHAVQHERRGIDAIVGSSRR